MNEWIIKKTDIFTSSLNGHHSWGWSSISRLIELVANRVCPRNEMIEVGLGDRPFDWNKWTRSSAKLWRFLMEKNRRETIHILHLILYYFNLAIQYLVTHLTLVICGFNWSFKSIKSLPVEILWGIMWCRDLNSRQLIPPAWPPLISVHAACALRISRGFSRVKLCMAMSIVSSSSFSFDPFYRDMFIVKLR